MGRVYSSKECYFIFTLTCFFHQKICAFIIFISFFDEASNFRNRILTNQKPGIGDKKLSVELYVNLQVFLTGKNRIKKQFFLSTLIKSVIFEAKSNEEPQVVSQ